MIIIHDRRWLRIGGALLVAGALALALLSALFLILRPPVAVASGPAPIEPWGTGSERTHSLTVGDMDNDGNLDLIVGNAGEPNRIYRNDGRGRFPITNVITLPNPGQDTRASAVASLDGDPSLDILALSSGQPAQLYLNPGQGFVTPTLLLTVTAPLTPVLAIGDLDGDADFDLVIGGEMSATRVYLNDGHASFRPADWLTTTASMSATAIALADVNVDGRLDLLLGFDGRPVQTFLNEGGAGFAPAGVIGAARGRVAALVAGHLNDDGRPDVGVAYSNLESKSQALAIYTNYTDTVASAPIRWDKTSDLSFSDNDTPLTLALGDLNNDDALDLAVGFGDRSGSAATRNRVLFNDGQARFSNGDVQFFGSGADRTYAIALADLDNDGRLDFIAANHQERHRIYFTQSSGPQLVFAGNPGGPRRTYLSLALGDLDGNGTLDMVAGADAGQLTYLHGDQSNFGVSATTYSLVLADLNRDGALDIVTGNGSGRSNIIYYNDGQGSFPSTRTVRMGGAMSDTLSVAVGDLDRDGWPDIVAGSKKQSAIYLNDSQGGFPVTRTYAFGGPTDPTTSVVVGDLNRDGWPDIVVGNENAANAVYFNDGAGHFSSAPDWRFGSEFEATKALALGDLNGDGDLDLVVANFFAPNVVYFNQGDGKFSTERAAYLGTLDNKTYSVALSDFDNDGALDIVAATWATADDVTWQTLDNAVYLNDGHGGFSNDRTVVLTRGKHYTRAVAVGDLNADGKPDIAFADRFDPNDATGRLMVYLNRRRADSHRRVETIHLITDGPITNQADLSATHRLTYSLAVPNGGCDFVVARELSLDNGAAWRALPFSKPLALHSRTATSAMATQVITWALPGDSGDWRDDIDVRLLLTSTVTPCRDRQPGPYQYSPFRQSQARIPILTPLQVISGSAPISAALVYRQAAGDRLAAPLAVPAGGPAATDLCGRLDSCGQAPDQVDLNHTDRLFALWPVTAPLALPISHTKLYHSSAPVIVIPPLRANAGLKNPHRVAVEPWEVSAPGTQTLTISASNPLLVFDLSVALEWDASSDRRYVAQLTHDLQRTSELLYDWTNGQAALGKITIFHDAARQPTANGSNRWLDADIRIFASNRLRPSATQGGVASAVISDPLKSDIAYGPGVVEIGATWNRFGESTAGNLAEDWPRALAHELGHYLFFLDDNYLGLDDNGLMIPVTDCSGVMADPYKEDDDNGNGEFHLPGAAWTGRCQQTLSQRSSGRADWATIETFYPSIKAPDVNTLGPDILPLNITQITEMTPVTSTATLAVPTFYLLDGAGRQAQPGPGARAFLYKSDGRIVDLGRPQLDQVQTRGAQVGDTLCVMDPDGRRQGCLDVVEHGNQELSLTALRADWNPAVSVSPVNSTTVAITLTGVPRDLALQARFVPSNAPLTTPITRTALTPGDSSYTATLPFNDAAGFIDITGQGCLASSGAQIGPAPCRITLDLTVGGSPAFIKGTGRLAFIKGTGRLAPVLSTDGQAMLFDQNLNLDPDHLAILQTAVTIPDLPAWATLVGHAYRLETSPNVTLTNASLNIGYLDNEAPPGEESSLLIHQWDETLGAWQPLPTSVATGSNNAVVAIHESGLYALLSSTEIQLPGAGWHAFGYPVADPPTRPVTVALSSLPDGAFTVVYGYNPANTSDPWSVYLPDAPALSDLTELSFGQGYFIHTTVSTVLRLKGLSPFASTAITTQRNLPPSELTPARTPRWSLVSPPALVYGQLQPSAGFAPSAGMTVSAWINGRRCGDGRTAGTDDGIGYAIKIHAANESAWQGCGAPGASITFALDTPAGALVASTPVTWANSTATVVNLGLVAPAAQCQELLRNGGFEQAGNWKMLTTASTARYASGAAHGGARAVRLGLLPSDPSRSAGVTLSSAYQDVRLPADAPRLNLTLWIKPGTQASSGDYQRLLLLDLTRGGSRELWRALENHDDWRQLSFDLTPYRGRTVRIYLEVKNDSQRLPGRTWLYVDDVSLRACLPS